MECRVQDGKTFVNIQDPYVTPGAHSNTVLSFSVLAAFRLAGFFFLLFAVSKRKRKQPSDVCYLLWLFLAATGYCLTAVMASVAVAGESAATSLAKVLVVLSWGPLMLSVSSALESVWPNKCLARTAGVVYLLAVLSGMLVVLMFPQDNNQVMLLVFSGLAFLLPISWCIVHKHTQDTPLGENLIRALLAVGCGAGSAIVGSSEPGCGFTGHVDCYERCWMGPAGQSLLILAGLDLIAVMGLTLFQVCKPEAWGFSCLRKPPVDPATPPEPGVA
ncbi:Pol [Symbiodinium sp. KB8]|nr:Pol [Symbiodinium sp. KB8]